LEPDLKSHIIGQDKAVSDVAKAIRRNRVGLINLDVQLVPSCLLALLVSVKPNSPNN
jgi:ATPases with chaperone activity, ATP-binding subunit